MAKPSWWIRAASLILGCCTPISPPAAKDRPLYYAFDPLYLVEQGRAGAEPV
jgi:hypothetical protein